MAAIYAACPNARPNRQCCGFCARCLRVGSRSTVEGPVRRCWSPDQRATGRAPLTGFKGRILRERARRTSERGGARSHRPLADAGMLGWTLAWTAFLVAFPWSRTVQSVFFCRIPEPENCSAWGLFRSCC